MFGNAAAIHFQREKTKQLLCEATSKLAVRAVDEEEVERIASRLHRFTSCYRWSLRISAWFWGEEEKGKAVEEGGSKVGAA